MKIELISVHVPKCGGVSLRQALKERFGEDAIYGDYADRPADPASPMNLDPDGFFERMSKREYRFLRDKKVVHGHFHLNKYRNLAASCRVTFLREPIDRLISHYFFWKGRRSKGHRLHTYFLNNDLDLFEFARLPTIRRFYTKTFFGGVDMKQFDLIGFHDRLPSDYRALQELIGLNADLPVRNTSRAVDYVSHREKILSDASLMKKLKDLLKDDLRFYEKLR